MPKIIKLELDVSSHGEYLHRVRIYTQDRVSVHDLNPEEAKRLGFFLSKWMREGKVQVCSHESSAEYIFKSFTGEQA